MTTQSERIKPNTMATMVYKQLREDIIDGVFPPGSHLVRRALAKRYGVSMLPVLEACLRLEIDGLVENNPLMGAFVVDVSPEKTRDELILREAIECQAAREFARRASRGDRARLAEAAKLLDAMQEQLTPDNREHEREFQRRHCEFHLAVVKMSGAALLYQQMKKLWYRRLMLICNVNTLLFPNPSGWHTGLAEILNGGDPDQADRKMRAHVLFNSEKNRESIREVQRRGSGELFDSILSGARTLDDAGG